MTRPIDRTHRFGAFTLDVDGQRLTIAKPPSALLGSLEWGDGKRLDAGWSALVGTYWEPY